MTLNLADIAYYDIREDDSNWPKKNIVGKQELEIRIGSDHIAFEVRDTICFIKKTNIPNRIL